MRVTAVIPSYNHAAFLERRIESVLGQTRPPDEVVLLDDASTDGSREILRGYEGRPGVRVAFSDVNSGSPFPQWDRGVGLATGELVWIAESDDDADPRLLGRLVERLEADSRVVLAHCDGHWVDEGDRPGRRHSDHLQRLTGGRGPWAEGDFEADGAGMVRRYMAGFTFIFNASGAVFRREAYLAAGGAPRHLRLCGDWLLWSRLLPLGRVAYVGEALNRHRDHGGTVRSSTAGQDGPAWLPQFLAVAREVVARHRPSRSEQRDAAGVILRAWEHWLRRVTPPATPVVAARAAAGIGRTFGPAAGARAWTRYLAHGTSAARQAKRIARPRLRGVPA